MEAIVWGVHYSKKNPDANKTDYRAITHGRFVHTCPLVHKAIFISSRLFMHSGRPLRGSDIRSKAWCVVLKCARVASL
jgi:hypothetical protein